MSILLNYNHCRSCATYSCSGYSCAPAPTGTKRAAVQLPGWQLFSRSLPNTSLLRECTRTVGGRQSSGINLHYAVSQFNSLQCVSPDSFAPFQTSAARSNRYATEICVLKFNNSEVAGCASSLLQPAQPTVEGWEPLSSDACL